MIQQTIKISFYTYDILQDLRYFVYHYVATGIPLVRKASHIYNAYLFFYLKTIYRTVKLFLNSNVERQLMINTLMTLYKYFDKL